MPARRFHHILTTGMLALLAAMAGASAHAQQLQPAPPPPVMPMAAEPLDAAGQACGNIRALPADVTNYRYEVRNRCQRPITFSWRCNTSDTEHSLDIAGQGTQLATCVKATGAAGEIIFRFGPLGTGN